MARSAGGRHAAVQPSSSHGPDSVRRNRLSPSFPVVTGPGFLVALLSLALMVGLGVVPTPLTAQTTKAPKLAVAQSAQPTMSSSSYARSTAGITPAGLPTASAPPASPTPRARVVVTPSRTAPSPPPSRTPRPSPSPVLVPIPTAENQTPKGRNELAWSEAILRAFGDPLTTANIVSLGYWMQNEAGHPPYGMVGANNPINVSQPGYGGTPIQNEGGGYFLYSYPTVKDGIDAIVAYLHRPNYAGIVAALKAGAGLSSPSLASEILVYSGNHYSTVPDSWGASQGRPET